MVVNALRNEDLDGFDLAEKMNKPRLRGIFPIIRRWPNSATFPWGMIDVFRDHGLKARWWFQVKKTTWLKDDEFQDQWKKYGRLLVEIENP